MSDRGNGGKLMKVHNGVTGGGDGFSQTSIKMPVTKGATRPHTMADGGASGSRGKKMSLKRTDGPTRPSTKASK